MKRADHMLKAFTMMDVLTGMVIMSLVIVMVFYLISATTRQTLTYQVVRYSLNEYLLLKGDLERSVEQAIRMESLPDGFRLVSLTGNVDYLQREHVLLRRSFESLDTVTHNMISLKKTFLDENPLRESVLSGVELSIGLGDQALKCYLFKEYGLAEPINQKLIREY